MIIPAMGNFHVGRISHLLLIFTPLFVVVIVVIQCCFMIGVNV